MKTNEIKDNTLLIELAKADQVDRALFSLGSISFDIVKIKDEKRLEQVENELKLDKVHTVQDYRNAGLIFHHSRIKKKHTKEMAVKMLHKSVTLNDYKSTGIKWLYAATVDRQLMDQNKPQIYGTQYTQDEHGTYTLYNLDTSKISVVERKKMGVLDIEEQDEAVRNLNRKQLVDVYAQNNSIEDVKNFCIKNDKKTTNITWKAISQFSFHLKRAGKIDESCQIFELAIKLYPNEYDLYHSLGLVYEETGKETKAIELIKKSLVINPTFQEAINDLKRITQNE